jgi:hypothetical protein
MKVSILSVYRFSCSTPVTCGCRCSEQRRSYVNKKITIVNR